MQNSSRRVWFVFAYIEFFRESVHRQILGQMRHQVTVKVAMGVFNNLDEAAMQMVERIKTYEPRPEYRKKYLEVFDRYDRLYDAVRGLM